MSSSDTPSGWDQVSLKDLAGERGLFVDGDWVESKDQDPTGAIRLLQLADIGDGAFLNKSDRWINDDAFSRLRCTELRAGDVLIARMPDPLGRTCLLPMLQERSITVVDVAALRVDPSLASNRWVTHTVNSPQVRTEIAIQSSGTTRKRISRGNLGELSIPLPPLAEQRRIADKLDTALARVHSLNDRLARVAPLLKRFRQSVLAAATSGKLTDDWRAETAAGDFSDTPSELGRLLGGRRAKASITSERQTPFVAERKALAELGSVSGGLTKNSKRADMSLVKPYLRVANVYANELRLDEVTSIGMTEAEYAKTRLETGDLLLVEGNGSLDQIGRVALWDGRIEGCSHQNHLIRWRSGKDVVPEYVLYWLLSPEGRQQIETIASSTTGLHTLSVSKVGALNVTVPPLAEQAEIVRRVDILFGYADRLEARLQAAQTAADRLTPALLAKAFRGELVSQDPNDEPASELLRRVNADTVPSSSTRSRKKSP